MPTSIPDTEVLVGIATLGLTLTGFSGLVAILGRRSTGQWTTVERFQLVQLTGLSLAVTFASFVPILASAALEESSAALRLSSGLIALVHIAPISYGIFNSIRNPEIVAAFPPGVTRFLESVGVLLILAGLACAFDFLGAHSLVILLNLLWMLMVGAVSFIKLLTNS